MSQSIFFGEGNPCVVYKRMNMNMANGQCGRGFLGEGTRIWTKQRLLEARLLLEFLEHRKQLVRVWRWITGRHHGMILLTEPITLKLFVLLKHSRVLRRNSTILHLVKRNYFDSFEKIGLRRKENICNGFIRIFALRGITKAL